MGTLNTINILIKLVVAIFAIYIVIYIYSTHVLDKRPTTKLYPFRKRPKYVLQWPGKKLAPFNYLEQGNSAFIKNKCEHTNCFVTDNATYLDLTEFDAIVFNGRNVIHMKPSQLPKQRSPKQKYIFGATESSHRFPVCNKVFDNFFNWTWTYKLSSDFGFEYITIYDLHGKPVGPAIDMKWPIYMEPISEELKTNLSSKSKAAAWFVSHCKTHSKREDFVANVQSELKNFGWNVDIYGYCGKYKCTRLECENKLQKEYFFYFAFENSFAEDYVTEKLLTALNNDALPVVFGSANYSRFLPPNSYLDARKLGPKDLARRMNELIVQKDKYYDFFRWKNHFSYKLTTATEDICKLCQILNNDQMVNTTSIWKNFRIWWNGDTHRHCSG